MQYRLSAEENRHSGRPVSHDNRLEPNQMNLDLPVLSDWNPSWNKVRDQIASRVAKKRIICAALDRLEFDLPENISVKAGEFTMKLTPRLADEKSLIRLRKKARQLTGDNSGAKICPAFRTRIEPSSNSKPLLWKSTATRRLRTPGFSGNSNMPPIWVWTLKQHSCWVT